MIIDVDPAAGDGGEVLGDRGARDRHDRLIQNADAAPVLGEVVGYDTALDRRGGGAEYVRLEIV